MGPERKTTQQWALWPAQSTVTLHIEVDCGANDQAMRMEVGEMLTKAGNDNIVRVPRYAI